MNMGKNRLLRAIKNSLKLDELPFIVDTMETIEKWDSLSHLNLIMDLEKEFGIRFPMNKIPDLNSVEAIVKELEKELDGRSQEAL